MTENVLFKKYRCANNDTLHEARTKFSDNSTGEMQAIQYYANDIDVYLVSIEVYRKRKNSNLSSRKSTGKVGLESVGWFLRAFKHFENDVQSAYFPAKIVIQASDKRRFDLYERILSPMGYFPTRFLNVPSLVKKFERRDEL